METPQSEPTFPVITIVGLTRDQFDEKEHAGALDVCRHSGGWWQVISIEQNANAAVLERLQAVVKQDPSIKVLTSLPNPLGKPLPLDPLISEILENKRRATELKPSSEEPKVS